MARVAKTNRSDRPIERLRVGVSSCLLGNEVRFDGGHKRDRFLVDLLGRFVEFVPVCPELELGLGVPREAIRLEAREAIHLEDSSAGVRLLGIASRIDHTDRMRAFARERVAALARENLCGYVLKKNSPSCGMERVRVYRESGIPSRNGRGMFAAELLQQMPGLPIEEEGRLQDSRLRENFIERLFAYYRLQGLLEDQWTAAQLIAFHTAHKLQLMAHSPRRYRELGRMVADVPQARSSVFGAAYARAFMQAMAEIATPARHHNVLQHIAGYFREHLDSAARTELSELIDDYSRELVPLLVPITLILHYVRCFGICYLQGQTYLDPHPQELRLRNRV